MKVSFPYNKSAILALKRAIPTDCRRWTGNCWEVSDEFTLQMAGLLARFYPDIAQEILNSPKYSEAREASHKYIQSFQASTATTSNKTFPAPEGLNYYPYQAAGIEYLTAHGGGLLADGCGLGKTIQVLGFANVQDCKRILVVCPAILKENWIEEANSWLVRDYNMYRVSPGVPFPKVEGERWLLAINYANLKRYFEELSALQPDLFVADEAHKITNWAKVEKNGVEEERGSDRAIYSYRLAEKAEYSIFVTGTPIVNKPKDLWPLIHHANPDYWSDWWSYGKRYCDGRETRWGWRFDGASHLDELQMRIRSTCMVRRAKAVALPHLPPKVRKIVPISTEGKREIEKLMGDEQASLKASTGGYEATIKRLEAGEDIKFKDMAKMRKKLALAKVPYVLEFVDHLLESRDQVVIFGHHRQLLKKIEKHYGEEAVLLIGGKAEATRTKLVKKFQRGEAKVFIGSMKAAETGLNLQNCDTVVFAELDWVPSTLTQAEDRCHRDGQESSTVWVYHLLFNKSLDYHIAQTVLQKQAILESSIDASEEGQAGKVGKDTEEMMKAAQSGSMDVLRGVLTEMEREEVKGMLVYARFMFDSNDGYDLIQKSPSLWTVKDTARALEICEKYKDELAEAEVAMCCFLEELGILKA